MSNMNLDFLHNISIMQIITVMCLTALTALAAHWGKAVFNDGIRPIIPEFAEGRMKRAELASISFGLSIGFIVSVGISFAVSFQLLNPWLLFLPTDILGVMATSSWMALGLGAIWGVVVLFGLAGVQALFSALPVDLIGALGELSTPVLIGFTAFPIIAILHQFGKIRALIAGLVVLVVRQLMPIIGGIFTSKADTYMNQAAQLGNVTFPQDADYAAKMDLLHKIANPSTDISNFISKAITNHSLGSTLSGFVMQIAVLMLVGMIFLISFAISRDLKRKRSEGNTVTDDEDAVNIFELQTKKIFKGLPVLAAIGGFIAVACNLGFFTGSDVAGPILQQAWAATGQERVNLLQSAALADVIRGLSFIPLIVTTALATGVYGVVGLTFVFPIGYLSPNPYVAFILGAIWISIEIFALRGIGRFLHRFPALRESSDYIRTAMNTMMELALFIGGALAALKMGTEAFGLGLTIYVLLYAANEGMGRPIMRLAAGPVAVIFTGVLLNILYFVHLL